MDGGGAAEGGDGIAGPRAVRRLVGELAVNEGIPLEPPERDHSARPDNTVTLRWPGAEQSPRYGAEPAMLRHRIPAFLAGGYAVLGLLSIVPVFTGDDALSAVFAVLLGSPWVQVVSAAFGSAGMSSPTPAAGLGLSGIGIAVNAGILYFVSRLLVRRTKAR